MTAIKIYQPSSVEPMIVEEPELLTFIMNLRFGDYYIRYGSDTVRERMIPVEEEEEDSKNSFMFLNKQIPSSDKEDEEHPPNCESCGDEMIKIPILKITNRDETVFFMPMTCEWTMTVNIVPIPKTDKLEIKVNVINSYEFEEEYDEECKICENNRFDFEIVSRVDNKFQLDTYMFQNGPFIPHPPIPPNPKEELDDTVLEDLK
jgi:hypothetical protein